MSESCKMKVISSLILGSGIFDSGSDVNKETSQKVLQLLVIYTPVSCIMQNGLCCLGFHQH